MSQGQDWVDRAMVPLRGLATPDYNGIYIAVGALGESAGPRLVEVIARLAVTAPEPDQRSQDDATRLRQGLERARQAISACSGSCGYVYVELTRLLDTTAAPSPLTPAPTSEAVTDAEATAAVYDYAEQRDCTLVTALHHVLNQFVKRRTVPAGLRRSDGE
jgi:hypothetical protein